MVEKRIDDAIAARLHATQTLGPIIIIRSSGFRQVKAKIQLKYFQVFRSLFAFVDFFKQIHFIGDNLDKIKTKESPPDGIEGVTKGNLVNLMRRGGQDVTDVVAAKKEVAQCCAVRYEQQHKKKKKERKEATSVRGSRTVMASTVGVVCVRKVPPCIQNLGPGAKKEPQSCVGGRLVRSFLL